MINITLNNKNFIEKNYIIKILLKEFLGVEYEIKNIEQEEDYVFQISNGNIIKFIASDLWKNKLPLNYLCQSSIPNSVFYTTNQYLEENDIPIIYGTDYLQIKPNSIECGIDIFASSFYMLTRWEEYANPSRDSHDRFSVTDSLAYKFNFLNRPIVNEYVEMLWNMLVSLGYPNPRKKWSYKFDLSHNVDNPFFWNNSLIHNIKKAGSLLKRNEIIPPFVKKRNYFIKDAYSTFDYLIENAKKINNNATYYFLSGGTSIYDNRYNLNEPRIKNLIKSLVEEGNQIGYHASYSSYENEIEIKKELNDLEKVCNFSIEKVRNHYLRFNTPNSWSLFSNAGLKQDATLTYAEIPGFRCGVCFPFSTFNFLSRTHLNLKEEPLIVMEHSLISYQNLSDTQIIDNFSQLNAKVRKYNGVFSMLWHNCFFSRKKILLQYLKKC